MSLLERLAARGQYEALSSIRGGKNVKNEAEAVSKANSPNKTKRNRLQSDSPAARKSTKKGGKRAKQPPIIEATEPELWYDDCTASVRDDCPPGAESASEACVSIHGEGEDADLIASGVCIDGHSGLILTAGHAAAVVGCTRTISFLDGRPSTAECTAVASEWDLALLRIITPQPKLKKRKKPRFPSVTLSMVTPGPKTKICCVGQPARPRGRRLEAVTGVVASVARDRLQEQHEDGALVHSCPVFAGNSGSALMRADDGALVGIHINHDMMRHTHNAVAVEAVQVFLNLQGVGSEP